MNNRAPLTRNLNIYELPFLDDPPVYLHFLNRELLRAVHIQISKTRSEELIFLTILSTTAPLYIPHSYLFESEVFSHGSPFIRGVLVLLRQKLVSSGVNFRDTLKKRCVEGTGHERGPIGTVWRLCRGARRSDRARGSNGAVAGLLPGLAAAGRT